MRMVLVFLLASMASTTMAHSIDQAVAGGCPSSKSATTESAETDDAAVSSAAAKKTNTGAPATRSAPATRRPSTRWHSLLPGMYR